MFKILYFNYLYKRLGGFYLEKPKNYNYIKNNILTFYCYKRFRDFDT